MAVNDDPAMETYNPTLDTWTSLFLIAVGQGLFLALVVFFKGRRKTNILLGSLLFIFSIMLFQYVLYWTQYIQVFPHLGGIVILAMYLLTPLMYLYLKAVKADGQLSHYDWLHFVPAFLFLLLILPTIPLDTSTKAKMLENGGMYRQQIPIISFFGHLARPWVQIIYQSTYLGLMGWLAFGQKNKGDTDSLMGIRNRWKRTLFFLYLGFILSYIGYYVMIMTHSYRRDWDYLISAFMCGFIYIVGWLGFRQPEIFAGQFYTASFMPKKYQNSTLTPSASRSILRKLKQIMHDEKPFLDSGLRLDDLAELVHCNRHQLSQVLNQEVGKNFPEYINEFRFEAARQMLLDPTYAQLPVKEIGYTSGFNNPTTFTKVFKEKTGLTPKAFQNEHLAERSRGV